MGREREHEMGVEGLKESSNLQGERERDEGHKRERERVGEREGERGREDEGGREVRRLTSPFW